MAGVKTSMVKMDDGVNIYAKLIGDELERKKPLLIGLHGAPGLFTHAEPEASLAKFSDNFRILIFDGRGSGASDMVGPYSHERWMKDIENLRIWCGEDTFVLAGHSYGGGLALDYAVNYTNRLRGLILIDTWTVGTLGAITALANILRSDRLNVDKERQIRVWSGNLISDQDYQEAIPEILPIYAPPGKSNDVATSAEFFGPRGAFHAKTQNWAFSKNLPVFDVRSRLKHIKVPTLVVVGRHDVITPLFFSEEIAREVPDAKLEIFENSGHSPQSDEPDKFREVLRGFLTARILRL